MSNTNIDYNNDILTQNLMTLSSFPVAFYSHLHNENIKLKTDNDNLEESNIKLRKRLNDCKDKIGIKCIIVKISLYEYLR